MGKKKIFKFYSWTKCFLIINCYQSFLTRRMTALTNSNQCMKHEAWFLKYLNVDDTRVQWDREPYVRNVLTALEGYAGLHCCLTLLEGLNLRDVFGRRPCEVLTNHFISIIFFFKEFKLLVMQRNTTVKKTFSITFDSKMIHPGPLIT